MDYRQDDEYGFSPDVVAMPQPGGDPPHNPSGAGSLPGLVCRLAPAVYAKTYSVSAVVVDEDGDAVEGDTFAPVVDRLDTAESLCDGYALGGRFRVPATHVQVNNGRGGVERRVRVRRAG